MLKPYICSRIFLYSYWAFSPVAIEGVNSNWTLLAGQFKKFQGFSPCQVPISINQSEIFLDFVKH